MQRSIALALTLGAVVLATMFVPASDTYGKDAKKRTYKYSVAQCNSQHRSCSRWCSSNRSGAEYDKCQQNCFDYYAKCMDARLRPGMPPPPVDPPRNSTGTP